MILPSWLSKLPPLRWVVGTVLLVGMVIWWLWRRARVAERRFAVEESLGYERRRYARRMSESNKISTMARQEASRRYQKETVRLQNERARLDAAASQGNEAVADLWNSTFRPAK